MPFTAPFARFRRLTFAAGVVLLAACPLAEAADFSLGSRAAALPAEEHTPVTPREHRPYRDEILLDSPEGMALLGDDPSPETIDLLEYWTPQYKSHCGAASAVIALNSMGREEPLTQNALFTRETAPIIAQESVYNSGFSLRRLARTISSRAGAGTEYYFAGDGEGQHGFGDFLDALEANRDNAEDRMIVNFSVTNLREGKGSGGGHHSPVAAYNAEAEMVLLLEVNANRRVAWVPAKNLSQAAATPTSANINRGWIVVEPPAENFIHNVRGGREPYEGIIPVYTDEGQALLESAGSADYRALDANWVAQYKSHCGAASTVVVANSLQRGAGYTQDNLFTDAVTPIITQDIVYQIGFTLEELENTIEARTGLEAERFHAGDAEGHHGFEAFVAALKASNSDPDDRVIVNFAGNVFRGRDNGGGHFSPIAAYDEASGQLLVLEINANRDIGWIDASRMFEAMAKTDSVSGMHRGWIVVRR